MYATIPKGDMGYDHAVHCSLAHVIVLWQMQKFRCYCTGFALFNFEFENNFQVQAPGELYLEGDLTNGFLGYEFGGLIFGGAYT